MCHGEGKYRMRIHLNKNESRKQGTANIWVNLKDYISLFFKENAQNKANNML